MKIIYEFDFLDEDILESNNMMIGSLHISSKEFNEVKSAIELSVQWALSSVFSTCFDGVLLVASDCPGDMVFAHLDADPYSKTVYIECNFLTIIDEYRKKELVNILKLDNPSLFEFVSFLMLHEMGHLVHCCFIPSKKNNIFLKLDIFSERYQQFHQRLDLLSQKTKLINIEKRYRKIPSEKTADSFAYSYLDEVIKSKNNSYN